MNIAGVLVCTTPENIGSLIAALESLSGVDVHQVERDTGRLIITIEGDDTEQDVGRLKQVKALDGVLSADMIHYHFEDDAVDPKGISTTADLGSADTPISYYQRIKST
jgi:periplasmic nitrate reductase NapD